MSTRLAALVGLVGLLVGCAPGFSVYDKPGMTYAEWRRDDAECRQGARRDGDIDQDAYARCMRERGYRLRGE